MIIKFTIHGNHEDPTGNPIPKIKKTANQYWTTQAQRYKEWKKFVQQAFDIAVGNWCIEQGKRLPWNRGNNKPVALNSNQKARMDLKIHWKNNAHADAENVFGSLADAIFESDKNLDGSFESQLAEDGKGWVEVKIEIKN